MFFSSLPSTREYKPSPFYLKCGNFKVYNRGKFLAPSIQMKLVGGQKYLALEHFIHLGASCLIVQPPEQGKLSNLTAWKDFPQA